MSVTIIIIIIMKEDWSTTKLIGVQQVFLNIMMMMFNVVIHVFLNDHTFKIIITDIYLFIVIKYLLPMWLRVWLGILYSIIKY